MKHDDNSGCGLTRVDLVLLPVANHHHRHHQLVHRRQFLYRETKKKCASIDRISIEEHNGENHVALRRLNQIKSFYSLIKYKYVLHMYTGWANKAIKLLQLPKKQNINQE